jgi:transcriptional regulator
VLLDEEAEGLALVTHLGRPDEDVHAIAAGGESLVIIQGNHGYVSPSWYAPGAIRAPTWNFTVAHCYGTPQALSPEENLDVLTRLVAHFEQRVEEPMYLDRDYAEPIARGTVGVRIPVDRFVCKRKLSGDKDPESLRRAIAALRRPGPYHHPQLADEMERVQADGDGA